MRMVVSFLVVAAVSVTLPAAADESEAPTVVTGTGAAVGPSTSHTLAQVHGGLGADATRVAGRSRDVESTTVAPTSFGVRVAVAPDASGASVVLPVTVPGRPVATAAPAPEPKAEPAELSSN